VTTRGVLHNAGFYQLGLGTAWAVPVSLDRSKRYGTLFAGVYLGIHEYPAVDADGIARIDSTLPRYNRLGSVAAKFDIAIPLTTRLDAIVQARFASPLTDNDNPDDWMLFVGASIPFGKMLRDLLGTTPE
jgi:hypothetical protein